MTADDPDYEPDLGPHATACLATRGETQLALLTAAVEVWQRPDDSASARRLRTQPRALCRRYDPFRGFVALGMLFAPTRIAATSRKYAPGYAGDLGDRAVAATGATVPALV